MPPRRLDIAPCTTCMMVSLPLLPQLSLAAQVRSEVEIYILVELYSLRYRLSLQSSLWTATPHLPPFPTKPTNIFSHFFSKILTISPISDAIAQPVQNSPGQRELTQKHHHKCTFYFIDFFIIIFFLRKSQLNKGTGPIPPAGAGRGIPLPGSEGTAAPPSTARWCRCSAPLRTYY